MAVLAILLFGGIFVLFIGGIVWLVRYYQRLKDEAWSAVAQRYGLHYSGRQIVGRLHDQAVRVCTVTRGSGDDKTTYTVISSTLPMALDLGFSLRKHGFINNMFHRSADHIIGDPTFDDTFIISADEEHRVRSLLGPKLRHLLLQQLSSSNKFTIGDHGATIETTGVSRSAPWLSWAIETCTRITAGMAKARESVPVATPLAHHRHAWRSFARANGLRGSDTPLCMWGTLEGANVQAYAVRTGAGQYEMEVALTLPTTLGIGLAVQPYGLMDKIVTFFGSQDHKLGDSLFDEAFRVKVTHVEAANLVLDERVRRELLMLQREIGPVSLSDNLLTVRLKQVPHHPSIVPRSVRRMLGVADQLCSRAESLTIGPYR
jgi:hypothetical protein